MSAPKVTWVHVEMAPAARHWCNLPAWIDEPGAYRQDPYPGEGSVLICDTCGRHYVVLEVSRDLRGYVERWREVLPLTDGTFVEKRPRWLRRPRRWPAVVA